MRHLRLELVSVLALGYYTPNRYPGIGVSIPEHIAIIRRSLCCLPIFVRLPEMDQGVVRL